MGIGQWRKFVRKPALKSFIRRSFSVLCIYSAQPINGNRISDPEPNGTDNCLQMEVGGGRGELERGRWEAIKRAERSKETVKEKERIQMEGRKKQGK